MSELKVNKISPRSGTDVTLGDSGDTFTVPAGASIVNNGTATGFGATGAVNWDTTAKTTGFTAATGIGYFCDTTSAGFTVTLPATPSAGDIVGLVDYAGTFDTNALVIDPNGEDIEGGTDNLQLDGEREGVVLVYVDSTQGWLPISGINEGTDALSPVPYSIDFLVVAGGGAGGESIADQLTGGAGGAGGYRTSTQTVNIGTVITVTVGDGGAVVDTLDGLSGSNSSISGSGLTTITSAGGGGGGGSPNTTAQNGKNGGSGGGGAGWTVPASGGSGNTPVTSPSQGNNGGAGVPSSSGQGAGGGGGANATGSAGSGSTGGNGGNGTASSITGSSVTRAGGGGGGGYASVPASSGGTGGGGDGGSSSVNAQAGTVNTGGGGGGSYNNSGGVSPQVAGAGGKGVVILSMPDASYSSTTTGSPTVATGVSGKTVLTFNGSGSYTA
jgi:hypothetical protein